MPPSLLCQKESHNLRFREPLIWLCQFKQTAFAPQLRDG